MSANETMAARQVLYRIPGMDAVVVERGLVYAERDGEVLTLDLYRPPGDAFVGPRPVVVVVAGFPDPGMRRIFGRPFKELGAVTSWCRLFAATGIAAVAYENRRPAEDLRALRGFLSSAGGERGLDAARVGLFATSGNGPLALGAVMTLPLVDGTPARCLALAYPYTLDLEGTTAVAEAQSAWGFANAAAGKSIDDLPRELPLLLVRAGRDRFAGLNEALDRLTFAGLRRNLPLECVNLPEAPHSFDLEQDGEPARRAIRRILAFFSEHLSVGAAQ